MCIFQHCTPDTPVVRWFWQIVEAYSEEMRARLLQFVTGSSRVPLQGFKALQGKSGLPPFNQQGLDEATT